MDRVSNTLLEYSIPCRDLMYKLRIIRMNSRVKTVFLLKIAKFLEYCVPEKSALFKLLIYKQNSIGWVRLERVRTHDSGMQYSQIGGAWTLRFWKKNIKKHKYSYCLSVKNGVGSV